MSAASSPMRRSNWWARPRNWPAPPAARPWWPSSAPPGWPNQVGGADAVLTVDHPALADYNPEAWEKALLGIVHRAPAPAGADRQLDHRDGHRRRPVGRLEGPAGRLRGGSRGRRGRYRRHGPGLRRQAAGRGRPHRRPRRLHGGGGLLPGGCRRHRQPRSRGACASRRTRRPQDVVPHDGGAGRRRRRHHRRRPPRLGGAGDRQPGQPGRGAGTGRRPRGAAVGLPAHHRLPAGCRRPARSASRASR